MLINLIVSLLLATWQCALALLDPADFFTGAAPRPRLEILHPSNGQILVDENLEIKLRVDGYKFPSPFHSSAICIGLSNGSKFSEQCFEESSDLTFRANGLNPGETYTLRVVFYERGNAIAVSVRNFRVGGIRSLIDGQESVLAIQTAMQVAIQLQLQGLEDAAKEIYEGVLTQLPNHADALHLLGVVLYRKGDPSSAIPLVEKALQTQTNLEEDYLNTLGECYRVLGRLEEAEKFFTMALNDDPERVTTLFNLGLTYQQSYKWDKAIEVYRQLSERDSIPNESESELAVRKNIKLESKTRECDLIHAQGRLEEALMCWQEATSMFANDNVAWNELGILYTQTGNYDTAIECFHKSSALGNNLASLNAAHVLEVLGFLYESRLGYSQALLDSISRNLPTYHIRVRQAMLLPRILPASKAEINEIRDTIEQELSQLLEMDSDSMISDNSQPLSFGYSLGYHLGFHGINNKKLKVKLHAVYSRLCPSLLKGYFLDKFSPDDWMAQEALLTDSLNWLLSNTSAAIDAETNQSEASQTANNSSTIDTDINSQDMPRRDLNQQESDEYSSEDFLDDPFSASQMKQETCRPDRPIRVGIISRYYYDHPVGVVALGLLSQMGKLNRECFNVTIYALHPRGSLRKDVVWNAVESLGLGIVHLPLNIELSSRTIRAEGLDIAIFPEIGGDPITYFLAYSRLAAVQAAWIGNPTTTGISQMDYFFSTDVEVESADDHYSERLLRLPHFGVSFVDLYENYISYLSQSTRVLLLERARLTEVLMIPKISHIYLVTQPLYTLHSTFDQVIAKLLLQDRVGYVVIMDSSIARNSWQRMYASRVVGRYSSDVRNRLVFYYPGNTDDMLRAIAVSHVVLDPFPHGDLTSSLQALALGTPVITMPTQLLGGRTTLGLYRMLDPIFRSNKRIINHNSNINDNSFAKLSNGVIATGEFKSQDNSRLLRDVVCIDTPGDAMPMCHSSSKINAKPIVKTDGDSDDFLSLLVINNEDEYVISAMKIAHKPKLRESISQYLLQRRSKLFGKDESAIWEKLLCTLHEKIGKM